MCIIIGVLSSVHDLNQRILIYCPKTLSYEAARYAHIGKLQIILECVRVIIRAIALLLLPVLTLTVGFKYRQIEKKKKLMISNNSGTTTNRMVKSSHLLILQIIQSATMFLTYFPLLYFYLNVYIFKPLGVDTLGKSAGLYVLIGSSSMSLGPGCNFIFYIILSKRFRIAAKVLISGWFSKFYSKRNKTNVSATSTKF